MTREFLHSAKLNDIYHIKRLILVDPFLVFGFDNVNLNFGNKFDILILPIPKIIKIGT